MSHKNRTKVEITCSQGHKPYSVQSWYRTQGIDERFYWVSHDQTKLDQMILLYENNEVNPPPSTFDESGYVLETGAVGLPRRHNSDISCKACVRRWGRSRSVQARGNILDAVLTALFEAGETPVEFDRFERDYEQCAEKYPRAAPRE